MEHRFLRLVGGLVAALLLAATPIFAQAPEDPDFSTAVELIENFQLWAGLFHRGACGGQGLLAAAPGGRARSLLFSGRPADAAPAACERMTCRDTGRRPLSGGPWDR